MKKYMVSIYYDEVVRETWEVSANNEEEALEKATAGEGESLGAKTTSGELISDVYDIEEVE